MVSELIFKNLSIIELNKMNAKIKAFFPRQLEIIIILFFLIKIFGFIFKCKLKFLIYFN